MGLVQGLYPDFLMCAFRVFLGLVKGVGLISGIVWFVIIVSPLSWFAEDGRKARKRAMTGASPSGLR